VFPERRGVGDAGFDVLNGLTQIVRQPGLQMVDVADNHEKTLDIKQRFIFIFYTRILTAIPPLSRGVLRQRMFIGDVVNLLLSQRRHLCSHYAYLHFLIISPAR
jgi:hypothetical protein